MKQEEIRKFLRALSSNCNDLNDCIKFCVQNRKGKSREIIIMSSSLLGALYEVNDYLDYFESQIEKKFGFNSLDEWQRVREIMFKDFLEKIENETYYNTSEKSMDLVASIISAWDSLHKESEEEILKRANLS
jgi:hypothetical protein